jgi:hypothetical protein
MKDMNEKSIIRMYSFYFKETEIPISNNIYIPVMAGNNSRPLNENYIGDDTGDSISDKNEYYSELTGLYWVWKNTKQDIVGSCHYRRYFIKKNIRFCIVLKHSSYQKPGSTKKEQVLSKQKILKNQGIELLVNLKLLSF